MFALLVPGCCDKSGITCYHLVTRLMMVTDSLQLVPTRLIQAVPNKLLRACCHQLGDNLLQTCWNNLLQVCWPHQPCYKMITTCSKLVRNGEQTMQTFLCVLRTPDLLEQPCNNSDNINKVVTTVNKLFHTCRQLGTGSVNTTC